MKETFTRQNLLDLVWAEPRTKISKKIGISDVGFAKMCRAANIPMPPRGYWARIETGEATEKPALPPRFPGAESDIQIGKSRYGWHNTSEPLELPPKPIFDEALEDLRQRVFVMVGKKKVRATLTIPHRWIAARLTEDSARISELTISPYSWKKPIYDTAFGRRRLGILSALFLCLENAGCRPLQFRHEDDEYSVVVGGTYVGFTIKESVTPRATKSKGESKRKLGQLTLALKYLHATEETVTTWHDSDRSHIEDQIGEIAAGIMIYGELRYRAWKMTRYNQILEDIARKEKEERDRQEEEKREREERRLKRTQQARDELLTQAENLQTADTIRHFVSVIRARPELSRSESDSDHVSEWATWALQHADDIDPRLAPIAGVVAPYYSQSGLED